MVKIEPNERARPSCLPYLHTIGAKCWVGCAGHGIITPAVSLCIILVSRSERAGYLTCYSELFFKSRNNAKTLYVVFYKIHSAPKSFQSTFHVIFRLHFRSEEESRENTKFVLFSGPIGEGNTFYVLDMRWHLNGPVRISAASSDALLHHE